MTHDSLIAARFIGSSKMLLALSLLLVPSACEHGEVEKRPTVHARSGSVGLKQALAFKAVEQASEPSPRAGGVLDTHTRLISQSLLDIYTGGKVVSQGADELIERLDEAQIEQALVLAFGHAPELTDAAAVRAENDFTASELVRHPNRLRGLCGINPLRADAQQEVERCLALKGMVGVHLRISEEGVDLTNRRHVASLSAMFDFLQERDAPVLIDTDAALATEKMASLANLLETHPGVRTLQSHCVGAADNDVGGSWKTVSVQRASLDNHFIDIGACLRADQDAASPTGEKLVANLRQWGIERVLLGSGYLAAAYAQTPQEALARLRALPLTRAELDIITSNDASGWLDGSQDTPNR